MRKLRTCTSRRLVTFVLVATATFAATPVSSSQAATSQKTSPAPKVTTASACLDLLAARSSLPSAWPPPATLLKRSARIDLTAHVALMATLQSRLHASVFPKQLSSLVQQTSNALSDTRKILALTINHPHDSTVTRTRDIRALGASWRHFLAKWHTLGLNMIATTSPVHTAYVGACGVVNNASLLATRIVIATENAARRAAPKSQNYHAPTFNDFVTQAKRSKYVTAQARVLLTQSGQVIAFVVAPAPGAVANPIYAANKTRVRLCIYVPNNFPALHSYPRGCPS